MTRLKPRDSLLNPNEEDEMKITGYRHSRSRTYLCWLCIVLTAGLLRLVMHWWRHWYLLATHSACSLAVAERVLIEEVYKGKKRIYYIKDVVTMTLDSLRNMPPDPQLINCPSTDSKIDGKNFHLSVHFASGIFKHTDTVRLFICKQLRYVWDTQSQTFLKLKGLDVNIPCTYLHSATGLPANEQLARRLVYGFNEITIPYKGVFTLLLLEMLNPFYVFQLFSVIFWALSNYHYYAAVVVLISTFGISMSVIQTKKNQDALCKTVQNTDCVRVLTETSDIKDLEAQYLVPGDVIEIPSIGCTLHCDAVLLSGNCILDESMLTGESVPVIKTPLPQKSDSIFDKVDHNRHTLFSGTKVIQTRNIGSENVLAIVINTGNITAKGELIRSILYPPPVDYKFEQDSYKFIAALGLFALIGFVYTVVSKIQRGIGAVKILVESLNVVTIIVPPALPAIMAVGRFYALKRLERKNIYCTAPRSINVSGSIDCVCFDKTGTLTEDGLDMWGVVPKSSMNHFGVALKQIDQLPVDHFLFAMVSCHSITVINGEARGDPLDLKMFESTGWLLEDTIVRQPKSNQSEIIGDCVDGGCNSISIVRQFPFTSALQRMSVVTRRLGADHFNVYCKGSPEMIHSLATASSIPENYFDQLDAYANQGYRIIAMAYKPLDENVTSTKVQHIGRDKFECDLEFLGFVVLENRLKPDSTEVIKCLTLADIRTIMVTGDNILTALSVAKECGIVGDKQRIIMVTTWVDPGNPLRYELCYNLMTMSVVTSNNICKYGDRDIELGLSLTTNDTYHFAMDGKTWSIVREHFPEYLQRLLTRGAVFARMAPDQKQSLIMELQKLNYYVAMCGDGANDCGALKVAHTGISLSETESSFSSPFTSRDATIACVPNVIREGRAALVTSFGIFKFMAAYSMVQFISVIILYSIDSGLTDWQYLFIDLGLVSVFAFFFGKTEAYDGPLVKQAPLSSLISLTPMASIILQMLLVIVFQVLVFFRVQQQEWFTPFVPDLNSVGKNLGCYENYAVFIISCFQYIILAFVFSKGAPYRKSVLSNYPFCISLIITSAFMIYLTVYPADFLILVLELVMPQENSFRVYMLIYGAVNFFLSLFIESVIVEFIIFKKIQKNEEYLSKHNAIENELRKDAKWPSISESNNVTRL